MNLKMILRIQSQALLAFTLMLLLPVLYALIEFKQLEDCLFFAIPGLITVSAGILFSHFGIGKFQRAPLPEAAAAVLLMYPTVAFFGALPFVLSGFLSPAEGFLEAVGNLTSAGLSILPADAPYILRLWQSALMWLGSLLFLIMLVSVLPEVGGCFGISLTLHGGHGFSSVIGQMNLMSFRVIKVYAALTVTSFAAFKLAGLSAWDSLLMAMRCISTGGGDFFPLQDTASVEYAAAFSMLLACGNFLLYYRAVHSLIPPPPEFKFDYFIRLKQYFSRLRRTLIPDLALILFNEETKIFCAAVLLSLLLLISHAFYHEIYLDANEVFRESFFHVVSFMSTTGIVFSEEAAQIHDFSKFFIFLMAVTGGCIGSVTGGFKLIRLIILFKITAAQVRKTVHPRMMTAVRVGSIPVPMQIAGKILAFFFLALVTMFICAAVLSFDGASFSEAVSMSVACLSTVGNLPGLCDADNFRSLSAFGKLFCTLILVIGRLEIFVLLIAVAGLKFRRKKTDW